VRAPDDGHEALATHAYGYSDQAAKNQGLAHLIIAHAGKRQAAATAGHYVKHLDESTALYRSLLKVAHRSRHTRVEGDVNRSALKLQTDRLACKQALTTPGSMGR
jgi:hypothetical protein